MRSLLRTRRGAVLWLLLPMALMLACGGSDESATQEAIGEAVEQVAEIAEMVAEGGDVDESWPFTHREVDAMRISSRIEYPMKESYRETVLEYERPDRTRDVTTIVEGPGGQSIVAERIFTSEKSYMWIADNMLVRDSVQDTVYLIDDALRIHTSVGRLEDAHKLRQFMQQLEGREELNGVEMLVYLQDDLDVILEGEQVQGTSRTWIGSEDGLVYKIIKEAQSATAHERSITTYEYGDSVTIEIPEE